MTAFDPYAFLDAAAAAVDLAVAPGQRDAVAANLVRLHALAQQLLDFEVPERSTQQAQDPS